MAREGIYNMTVVAPNFINSPFFVGEPRNWHLKPEAPKEVVQEFSDFMHAMKLQEVPDITVEEMPWSLFK